MALVSENVICSLKHNIHINQRFFLINQRAFVASTCNMQHSEYAPLEGNPSLWYQNPAHWTHTIHRDHHPTTPLYHIHAPI